MKSAVASQALTPGSFLKAAQTSIEASMLSNYGLNLPWRKSGNTEERVNELRAALVSEGKFATFEILGSTR
jgi:hypothetical protein